MLWGSGRIRVEDTATQGRGLSFGPPIIGKEIIKKGFIEKNIFILEVMRHEEMELQDKNTIFKRLTQQ